MIKAKQTKRAQKKIVQVSKFTNGFLNDNLKLKDHFSIDDTYIPSTSTHLDFENPPAFTCFDDAALFLLALKERCAEVNDSRLKILLTLVESDVLFVNK